MTGFGREIFVKEGKSIVIEIRTLNSKQADINTRIAPPFREYENEIRSIILKQLIRGKIDVSIYIENDEKTTAHINTELMKSYYETLTSLSTELAVPIVPELFFQILKLPDVISIQDTGSDEEMKEELLIAVEKACQKVDEFRESEGGFLAQDIKKRVALIQKKVEEITPFETERINQLREKIVSHLSTLPPDISYNKNRFEEEMIYYLEKIDITEEKVRLDKHNRYFLATIDQDGQNGKKLSFITQEIGREINTIGSKANNFNIQQIVVNMKDELEKIKEQLNNIL